MPGTKVSKITVDFTNVSIGGGKRSDHFREGDYLMEVFECEKDTKKDDKTSEYLRWGTRVVKPEAFAGKKIYHITSLREEALWNLRTFAAALLGEDKVPQRRLDLPIAKIVEKKVKFGATVVDGEPYNGKVKSEFAAVYHRSEYVEQAIDPGSDDDDTGDATAIDEEADDDEASDDVDELEVDDL